jgi:membrane fusion protein (multidrug efflux system)
MEPSTPSSDTNATPTPPAATPGPSPAPPAVPAKGHGRRNLIVLVLLVLIAIGGVWYWYASAWESTDDAQIDGYVFPISARVRGHVVRVTVDDNQYVAAGTVLVQLDPKDYEVAVSVAQGQLANDRATAAATSAGVPITTTSTASRVSTAEATIDAAKAQINAAERQFEGTQASLRQTQANDLRAQDDVNRYKPLAAKDEIPQQQYDTAVRAQQASAAAVEAARASASAAEQTVSEARARLAQAVAELRSSQTAPEQVEAQRARARAADAQVLSSLAELDQAQLNLQYTTIVAPVSGIVGRRGVQQGQNVAVNQQLLTIVPLDRSNIWVTANFKETQLRYMRPGQPATISVDAYGREYRGKVLNIAGASGARYSLLPPENATGNYVKVVQRIPVRIVFDEGQDAEHLLRLGMSVEPSVRVR